MNIDISYYDCLEVFREWSCEVCTLSKQRRLSHNLGRGEDNAKKLLTGQVISCDPIGPITPHSRLGAIYVYVFACQATAYIHAFSTKKKSDYPVCLRQVIEWYALKHHYVKTVRTDAEKINISTEVKDILAKFEVSIETSAEYQHHQNFAERQIQTLQHGVSRLIHAQHWLGASCWDFAVANWVQLHNNHINSHHKKLTPVQRCKC